MSSESRNKLKNLCLFVLPSFLGVWMFLVPFPIKGLTNTFIGHAKFFLLVFFADQLEYIVLAVCASASLLSLFARIFHPRWLTDGSRSVREALLCNDIFLLARAACLPVTLMVLFGSTETFGSLYVFAHIVVREVAAKLIMLAAVMSLTAPLLLDFGLVQFTAAFASPVMRPLFKVPGRSAVDCVASWLGSSSMAVVITAKMHSRGHYSHKEAAIMVSSFSLAGIYNIYAFAEILDMTHTFTSIVATTYISMFFLAIVLPRIWPLRSIPDEYEGGKRYAEHRMGRHGHSVLFRAIFQAKRTASHMTFKTYVHESLMIALPMLFGTVPLMITFGTLIVVIAEMTPFADIFSLPFYTMLNAFGAAEARGIANAAVFAYIDQYIAAVYAQTLLTESARFTAICMAAVGLINLTEIGLHVVDSTVPLKMWQMTVIYFMRASLSLIIILPAAAIIFN